MNPTQQKIAKNAKISSLPSRASVQTLAGHASRSVFRCRKAGGRYRSRKWVIRN